MGFYISMHGTGRAYREPVYCRRLKRRFQRGLRSAFRMTPTSALSVVVTNGRMSRGIDRISSP
jgi:hypothetical protein